MARVAASQCYVWWNNRQRSEVQDDRRFATKRMVLLYVAKMNSDAFCAYLSEVGRDWASTCRPGGSQDAVEPNRPFDTDFLELSDQQLDAYGSGVGQAFAVVKASKGTTYQWAPRAVRTTPPAELAELLLADRTPNKRQKDA